MKVLVLGLRLVTNPPDGMIGIFLGGKLWWVFPTNLGKNPGNIRVTTGLHPENGGISRVDSFWKLGFSGFHVIFRGLQNSQLVNMLGGTLPRSSRLFLCKADID